MSVYLLLFAIFISIDAFSIFQHDCELSGGCGQRDGFVSALTKFAGILETHEEIQDRSSKIEQFSFCGETMSKSGRIVGGATATFGQFPWQAQVYAEDSFNQKPKFTCGGTLVSHDLIITAAHCIKYTSPERYSVILGRQYLNLKDEICPGYEQKFQVVRMAVHPEFNKRHLTNDIALLWIRSKFNQTVHFTDYILPACLPDLNEHFRHYYPVGNYGTVSGIVYFPDFEFCRAFLLIEKERQNSN